MAKHKRVTITKEVLAAALSLNARRAARARAESLTPERRREIARMGGAATKAKWARIRRDGKG
jgi:general stress protein YciG